MKSEKGDLLEEIAKLRKAGQEKACILENEIVTLRKEVELSKEVMGDFG